jgi:hypothetical protein
MELPLCSFCRINRVRRTGQRLCSRTCAMASRGRSIQSRFYDFFSPGEPDDCWPWRGTIHRGYGVIGDRNNRQYLAHRLSYEIHKGPIPNGLYVCHACDNPPCVNPRHLWIGDDAANQRDKALKGRAPRGERHHRAKLTADDVRAIRRLYPQSSQTEIAARYRMNQTVISDIVRGASWKHVTD